MIAIYILIGLITTLCAAVIVGLVKLGDEITNQMNDINTEWNKRYLVLNEKIDGLLALRRADHNTNEEDVKEMDALITAFNNFASTIQTDLTHIKFLISQNSDANNTVNTDISEIVQPSASASKKHRNRKKKETNTNE